MPRSSACAPGGELRGAKRRAVRRFRASQRRPAALVAIARLWVRARAARQRRSPTMGMERALVRGLAWRELLPVNAALRRRKREYHAQGIAAPQPPPIDGRAPQLRPGEGQPLLVRQIPTKIAPLPLEVSDREPRRVNMLVPLIDLEHFFAAYIGKFNLALRLAESGHRVRMVAVEPSFLPDDWRQRLRGYAGLESFVDRVEIAAAPTREQLRLKVSPEDRFMATTSWTAHVAHRASQQLGRNRFIFVIQEYDALTYPVGTRSAVVREAYRYPHFAVFSTELLRGYFRDHGLGVYGVDGRGPADSISFRNAITPVDPPSAAELAGQEQRLLFYARPEAHAERNMFELGLLALAEAIESGCFRGDWEFVGIGAQTPARVPVTGSAVLRIAARRPQAEYQRMLHGFCVGLSLQDTPHPSLVPLEMAAAGTLAVTSTFENKTRDSLVAISENLIPAEPTVEGVRQALFEAVARIGDHDRRARAAHFDWPRSWDAVFDEEFIAGLNRFLDAA